MACSDGGRGRWSVSEEFFNSSVADVTINPDISKELGKGGLRVQARCEQERPCSSVLLDKIRMRCTNLQEECHCIVDISSHWRPLAKVTGRQQHNLVAGSKDVRHQRLVYKRALRAYSLDEGIPIPAESHEGVNTRLHSL